ncbi:hypothetical protein F511_20506 [Dorcoceras hygrometricum]|uniref:Uncharacterized protein n=1 Tax=Dorcoceras hygrometricum TaxID=472368 RepID=A0A2Z7CP24_9LAMI|nr:hypothetical protein F511_20506 [Dorcoceras hygrometricum]
MSYFEDNRQCRAPHLPAGLSVSRYETSSHEHWQQQVFQVSQLVVEMAQLLRVARSIHSCIARSNNPDHALDSSHRTTSPFNTGIPKLFNSKLLSSKDLAEEGSFKPTKQLSSEYCLATKTENHEHHLPNSRTTQLGMLSTAGDTAIGTLNIWRYEAHQNNSTAGDQKLTGTNQQLETRGSQNNSIAIGCFSGLPFWQLVPGSDQFREETGTSRKCTPQNPLPMLNTLSSVSMRESRIQYLCDPQWFRDTASRGPTTIAAPESQFRTCPSDHGKRTTMHRLLHASGSHPIPPPNDPK